MGGLQQVACLLLLLGAMVGLTSACSEQLLAICDCENYVQGFEITCDGVNNGSALVEALASVRGKVQQLTIKGSDMGESTLTDQMFSGTGLDVRSLEISGCSITKVAPGAFDALSSVLVELVLSNNSIDTFPVFTAKMDKLSAINLNGNKLKDVPKDALVNAPNLQQLRLERNHICNMDRNGLEETKDSLELLDLSDNCLSGVPARNLRGLNRLMYLDLSNNRLPELVSMQFMNLPKLKEVRLNGNNIVNVHPMAFMNVPELQYLYLRDNRLTKLDDRFQAFGKLEVLDLSGNRFRVIPTSSFKDVASLKQVYLDNNQIERIETLAFSSNKKLQMISIQNNALSTLSFNSFDSLEQLVILLLANNSLTAIESGMFDGMPRLQQLNLRNNSIQRIAPGSFDSTQEVTTLDLALNKLTELRKGTLAKLNKLFWLDVSGNELTTFEDGTFTAKVPNLILNNNPWRCDESFDWFVKYLVSYNVRTFLPYQEEVTCAAPEKYAGVRLKELMIKKANESFTNGLRSRFALSALGVQNPVGSSNPLLGSLLPSLGQLPGLTQGIPGLTSAIPYLGAITRAVPSLGDIPALNLLPVDRSAGGGGGLNQAVEDFARPLGRFATGRQPLASDVNDFLGSIPNLVTNLPGFGNIDISKLPPQLITHVLNGGAVPGVPQATLNQIVRSHMQRMAEVAAAARNGQIDESTTRYLPPISELPPTMIQGVLAGETLAGLDAAQTKVIREFYTNPPPSLITAAGNTVTADGGVGRPLQISLADLMKSIPPGFDLTRLSPAVLQSIAKGETPDVRLLPDDLLRALKQSRPELFNADGQPIAASPAQAKQPATLDELLQNLPQNNRQPNFTGVTFRPYDIDAIERVNVDGAPTIQEAARIGLYTAVGLGAIGALTIVMVAVLCYRRRRSRDGRAGNSTGSSFEVDDVSTMDNTRFFQPKTSSPKVDAVNYSLVNGLPHAQQKSGAPAAGCYPTTPVGHQTAPTFLHPSTPFSATSNNNNNNNNNFYNNNNNNNSPFNGSAPFSYGLAPMPPQRPPPPRSSANMI